MCTSLHWRLMPEQLQVHARPLCCCVLTAAEESIACYRLFHAFYGTCVCCGTSNYFSHCFDFFFQNFKTSSAAALYISFSAFSLLQIVVNLLFWWERKLKCRSLNRDQHRYAAPTMSHGTRDAKIDAFPSGFSWAVTWRLHLYLQISRKLGSIQLLNVAIRWKMIQLWQLRRVFSHHFSAAKIPL